MVKKSHKKNCSSSDGDTKYILPIILAIILECYNLALAFQV